MYLKGLSDLVWELMKKLKGSFYKFPFKTRASENFSRTLFLSFETEEFLAGFQSFMTMNEEFRYLSLLSFRNGRISSKLSKLGEFQ